MPKPVQTLLTIAYIKSLCKILKIEKIRQLKVEICGVNTSELPVLKNKQMKELLLQIKNGDEEARQQFVRGNLRLVLSVIKKFNNRGENIDDLFQIGCIGLIKAIDNFDLSQNVRFSTYAVPMIIGEIRRYLRDNNPIRVSRSLKDIAYKALQVRERLIRTNSKEPTVSEIAKELELEVESVVMALDAIQDPISLFDPVYQDNGDAIFVMDQVQDKKDTDENWLQEISLKEAIKKLNSREKLVLDLRFYKGRTQIEVADEIGISQAQVSRIEKNALKNMRKYV
ncbi:RNA polymerase sporulation sigma factor SigG [Clostridioides difficile]|nr:RNA polymerase sporulation sigma factor SigG [Clostridioides difficile]